MLHPLVQCTLVPKQEGNHSASTKKAVRKQATPKKETRKAIILDMLRGLDTQVLQNEIEAHIAEQIRSSNHKCKEMTAY
uniref:Uncharacterized protein n=1 Tax=Amphimedon queenslandica TaxID=400682 RepID=A0A1X7VHN5_AMPQE